MPGEGLEADGGNTGAESSFCRRWVDRSLSRPELLWKAPEGRSRCIGS